MKKTILLVTIVFIFGVIGLEFKTSKVLINNPRYEDLNGQAMVTFSYDDGFANNYQLALPLHEKYGVPATFNIIASTMVNENPDRFMDRKMTADSVARGIEIASHSYYHDGWMTEKTDKEIHFEMSESQKVLKDVIGTNVETIAIPYSQYDERVKDIVKQYYLGARVYGGKLNSITSNDNFELNSNIAVDNTTTFEDVKTRIDRAIENKQWIIIMLHGINPDNIGIYEITPNLLEQILQYVSSFDRNILLPINTRDGIIFSENYKKTL